MADESKKLIHIELIVPEEQAEAAVLGLQTKIAEFGLTLASEITITAAPDEDRPRHSITSSDAD